MRYAARFCRHGVRRERGRGNRVNSSRRRCVIGGSGGTTLGGSYCAVEQYDLVIAPNLLRSSDAADAGAPPELGLKETQHRLLLSAELVRAWTARSLAAARREPSP
jgi:hypothetical protein